jgi:hypothetical protein
MPFEMGDSVRIRAVAACSGYGPIAWIKEFRRDENRIAPAMPHDVSNIAH